MSSSSDLPAKPTGSPPGQSPGSPTGSPTGSPVGSPSSSAAGSTSSGKAPYVFASATPYVEERIGAVAIYCSDGRLGDHTDDFLHQGLSLPRYDRLACPGGAAGLSGRPTAYWESVALLTQLRFLVQAHSVQVIVLIAHEGCAYYRERLALPADMIEEQQLLDLRRATDAITRLGPELQLYSFYARKRQGKVLFEHVRVYPTE